MLPDPVCGMEVDEAKAVCTKSHRGKTWAFCSAWCRKLFEADPDRYMGKGFGSGLGKRRSPDDPGAGGGGGGKPPRG